MQDTSPGDNPGWISLPRDLVADPNVRKIAKVVALGLAALVDGDGLVTRENALIGEACGLSIRHVQEGLHALEQAGWITRGSQVRGSEFRKIQVLWVVPGVGNRVIG